MLIVVLAYVLANNFALITVRCITADRYELLHIVASLTYRWLLSYTYTMDGVRVLIVTHTRGSNLLQPQKLHKGHDHEGAHIHCIF